MPPHPGMGTPRPGGAASPLTVTMCGCDRERASSASTSAAWGPMQLSSRSDPRAPPSRAK